ncbi:MAG TPA: hypothetical protein VKE40_11775 [Gemmataceae bacterium]|nr:hypothetical protein [Gemmataceae bacterium]
MIPTLLALLAGQAAVSAAENVKAFPTYKCQYTLPGNDWSWAEPPSGVQADCMARSGGGLVFILIVSPFPVDRVIDLKAVSEFDQGINRVVAAKKQGGRITIFRGLPCYQSEWVADRKLTAAIRVVAANGLSYGLLLCGKTDPVEKRPDFEAIMNGFEFTSPPVPHSAAATDPNERIAKISQRAGEVGVYCLAAALVLGLLVRGARKKSESV